MTAPIRPGSVLTLDRLRLAVTRNHSTAVRTGRPTHHRTAQPVRMPRAQSPR